MKGFSRVLSYRDQGCKDEMRDDLQSGKTLISPGMFLTDFLSDRKVFILINIFHTLYFIITHSSHQS